MVRHLEGWDISGCVFLGNGARRKLQIQQVQDWGLCLVPGESLVESFSKSHRNSHWEGDWQLFNEHADVWTWKQQQDPLPGTVLRQQKYKWKDIAISLLSALLPVPSERRKTSTENKKKTRGGGKQREFVSWNLRESVKVMDRVSICRRNHIVTNGEHVATWEFYNIYW